jgi:hypothetical protein
VHSRCPKTQNERTSTLIRGRFRSARRDSQFSILNNGMARTSTFPALQCPEPGIRLKRIHRCLPSYHSS